MVSKKKDDDMIEETIVTTTTVTTTKKKKKNPIVEIYAVLDRSGSMGSIINDAIGGFNTFLKQQKEVKGKANLTIVLFDDVVETIVESKDIQQVEELTNKTYVPRGMTSLYDAIGRSLNELEAKNPDKAIVCILTDGEENSSKEFNSEKVKQKIKAAEERGWQVVYLGANQDAFAVGGSLGIAKGATRNFTANAAGVADAYVGMSMLSTSYRTSGNNPLMNSSDTDEV